MDYDSKYDNMPLRGKVSICDAMIREYSQYRWAYDWSRRDGRKYHRHYDYYNNWWKDDTIGKNWFWQGVSPSKGHKRKTWKDYRYAAGR